MRFFREAEPGIHVAAGRLASEEDGRAWTGEYDAVLAAGRPVAIVVDTADRPEPPAGKPMAIWMKRRRPDLARLVRVVVYVCADGEARDALERSLAAHARSYPYPTATAASEAAALEKARASLSG